MSLYNRIKENLLPKRQLQVIEAILDDLESNSFLSGQELCEKFDISFSSLTRMSKTLQFSGFPDMKREIESLYRDEYSPSSKAESFIKDTRDKSIFNIVLNSEVRSINKLAGSIHEIDLVNCAKEVNQSKRVFVVGVGQMKYVTQKFSESLKMLGKEVICFTELGFSKSCEIYSIDKDDIVITFSINKELAEIKEFFLSLKVVQARTILFTDKKTGRLRNYSDTSFYAPSTGNGMINCLTPFIVVTNVLESILFSLDKHTHLSKVRKIEKKWGSLPIFLD